MTKEQMAYVLHNIEDESYLKACPGSGKTESIATKAAYLLNSSAWSFKGIAFLTFTNAAAEVVQARVARSAGPTTYPHYIGTIDAWLHGYLLQPFSRVITKFAGHDGDFSVSIIDNRSSASFLSSFSTPAIQGIGPIRANQFYYTPEGALVFSTGAQSLDMACSKRHWTANEITRFSEIKDAFWKAGFATYADAETISLRLLAKFPGLAANVATRFPFFVVDECQDLGPNQLAVFDLLRQAGAKFHFVGDHNQAIYSFRKADATLVLNFANERAFKELELTYNFRSLQPIVDFCGQLIAHGDIKGQSHEGPDPVCLYFTYDSENDIAQVLAKFEELVVARGIDLEKSLVLARASQLVARLNAHHHQSGQNTCLRFARAVHLYHSGDLDSTREALILGGEIIAEICFPEIPTSSYAYHQPRTFSSPAKWRLHVAEILRRCSESIAFTNFNRNWSAWAKDANSELPKIIRIVFGEAQGNVQPGFRSPQGMAAMLVAVSMVGAAAEKALKCSTIHKVKGQTLEAVLLLSAGTAQSKGGHWTQWLNIEAEDGEYSRFAYVACSRPQKLIAWAVPTPTEAHKVRLEALGLTLVT